jgi:glycosyltransferase involved in cell wall biosynthesis
MPSGMSTRIDGLVSQLLKTDIDPEVITPIFYENYVCLKRDANNIKTLNLRWLWSLKLIPSLIVKLLALIIFHIFSFVIISMRFLFGGRRNGMVVQYQDVFSAPPAILARALFGVKIIGDDLRLYFKNQKPPFSWIQRVYEVLILKNTDYVITSFKLDYRLIMDMRENRNVLFVPNGIKIDSNSSKVARDHNSVIFVGQFASAANVKALGDILYVAERLEKFRDLTFYIVGGPLATVKELAQKHGSKATNVRFLGRVSQKKLDFLYKTKAIGILPYFERSKHTSQRIKALEYLSNGLLVVASPGAVDGFKGLRDGTHYVCVETREAMTMSLEKILLNYSDFVHVAPAGKDFIFQNYTWEKVADSYLKLIESLNSDNSNEFATNVTRCIQ